MNDTITQVCLKIKGSAKFNLVHEVKLRHPDIREYNRYMNKGYIVPVILVVLLLALAGFFLFSGQFVENPRDFVPTPIATTTKEDLIPVIEEDIEEDDTATTTDIETDIQATSSTSTDQTE